MVEEPQADKEVDIRSPQVARKSLMLYSHKGHGSIHRCCSHQSMTRVAWLRVGDLTSTSISRVELRIPVPDRRVLKLIEIGEPAPRKEESVMELMTKLKEMIPWKRKPVETHEVMSLHDDINQLFDRFLMSPLETGWSRFAGVGSGIEMYETEEYVILRVDVPGVDPKHLSVTIRNGILCVSYEDQREWYNGNGEGSSSRYTAFRRSVALPDGLDLSKAEAACKHGVLVVRIPWTPVARDRSRTIEVSVD
jgi:HSP20 family protein